MSEMRKALALNNKYLSHSSSVTKKAGLDTLTYIYVRSIQMWQLSCSIVRACVRVMVHSLTLVRYRCDTRTNCATPITCISGFIAPFMMTTLLGEAGGYILLTMVTMALMSTGSGEVMAISSIIVYDIYKTHINPFRYAKSFLLLISKMKCMRIVWLRIRRGFTGRLIRIQTVFQ